MKRDQMERIRNGIVRVQISAGKRFSLISFTMWSRIVSLVDDLNYEEGEEYSDVSTGNEEHGRRSVSEELESTKSELKKYKEKVLKLKEELRDAETSSQELNHEYGRLIQEKEDENAQLKKQIEEVRIGLGLEE